MGRWLEILTERPPEDESYVDSRPEIVVGEIAPHPLLNAAHILPREARIEFSNLHKLRPDSGYYDGEDLWLNPVEAGQLLTEFERFRRVERYEEYVQGLTAEHIRAHWKADSQEADRIEILLRQAKDEELWVHVML